MRPPIGSYDWCEAHEGKLNKPEKLKMIAMLLQSQIQDLFEGALYRLPLFQSRLSRVNIDTIQIPDSSIALEALNYASGKYSRELLLHCYRTYYFGAMLGQGYGYKVDSELLFVSSILHDLGISPGELHRCSHACFARSGAREASRLVSTLGMNEDRSRKVYEAISHHLNPIINAKAHGLETQLLAYGATMDVIGSRLHRIPLQHIQLVHNRYPRAGLKEEIIQSMELVEHAPDVRSSFLFQLGFKSIAGKNKLDQSQFREGN